MPAWEKTSIPGIESRQPPTAQLDLLSAPQERLKEIGLPGRPDPNSQPKEFARWLRLANSTWIVPDIERTRYRHGPVKHDEAEDSTNNSIWSGIVLQYPAAPIAAANSGGRIYADFVVPSANPPNTAGETHCSIWVGIDGYNTSDVEQAGIHLIYNGGVTSYFWFEWFPDYEIKVNNLAVVPGESVGVIVDYEANSNNGYCYLTNNTRNQSVGFKMTPPSGVRLAGTCLEWIVERPGIGGQISTLMPYNPFAMVNCDANIFDLPGVTFPGQPQTGGTITILSMTNNNGQVISQCALGPPTQYNGKQLFDNMLFVYNRVYNVSEGGGTTTGNPEPT